MNVLIAVTTWLRVWKDILYFAKTKLPVSFLIGQPIQEIYVLRSEQSWWISWNMKFLLKQYRTIFSSMNVYFAVPPPPPPFFFWPITSTFHFLFLFMLNALRWKARTKSISFTTNLFCPLSDQLLSWPRSNYFPVLMNIPHSAYIPQPLLQSCDTWISSTSSGVSLPFQAFLSAAYLLFTYLLPFPSLLLLPVQTLLKLLFLHPFHVTLPWIFIPWQCCRMHCPCWLFCPVSTASPKYFLQLNSPAISAPALWPSDLFCFSDSLFSTA